MEWWANDRVQNRSTCRKAQKPVWKSCVGSLMAESMFGQLKQAAILNTASPDTCHRQKLLFEPFTSL